MLCDKTSSTDTNSALLSRDPLTSAVREADAERDYVKHRNGVVSMLRLKFAEPLDYEELYQEAWAELLEIRARGELVEHPQALLRKIAWRRAVDAGRRHRPEPLDPSSVVFANTADASMGVAEEAGLHLDADALRLVIETLEPREAVALKLRFDLQLTGPEIQKCLGVTAKVYEQIITRAYKAVREQVEPDGEGDTRWRRRQRSLLLLCEMGLASSEQIEQARKLVARDPRCRAMLRSMRSTLRQVAAVLPMPPAAFDLERKRGPFGAIADWTEHAVATIRHAMSGGAPSGPMVEQASGGLAGGVGIGGAAKVIAVCLAVGGTAAVCVRNVIPADTAPRHPAGGAAAAPAVTRPVATVVPVVAPAGAQPITGTRVRRTHAQVVARASRREVPVSSPAASSAPSPAPAGATEFGPGTSGSAPKSPSPAAAPANGGGEFGP